MIGILIKIVKGLIMAKRKSRKKVDADVEKKEVEAVKKVDKKIDKYQDALADGYQLIKIKTDGTYVLGKDGKRLFIKE